MVNPTPSSDLSSAPSSPSSLSTGTTARSTTAEEGCNDEPPPILSPPVGNAAGGVTSSIRPDCAAGASSVTIRTQQNETEKQLQTLDPKVYDYGFPGRTGVNAGNGTAQEDSRISTTTTAASSVTDVSPHAAISSGQSSVTAVDVTPAFGIAGKTVNSSVQSVFSGEHPHAATPVAIAAAYGVDLKQGLTSSDAQARLEKDGPNTLTADEGVKWYSVLVRQVSNSLTLVLAIAMAASYGMLDFIEGSVITAVIILNITIGFVQDYRAEKTMQSLHTLSAPIATVLRNDSRICKIRAEEIVVGDIVSVSVGDVVPADLRLFEGMNFETNEALLTGESLPIVKTPALTCKSFDIPLGDRTNMAYASSTVTKGRALGVAVSTGMCTEVGKIAELLRGRKEEDVGKGVVARAWGKLKRGGKSVLGLVGTPLQVKLSKFALVLFGVAILLAIIVFSANKWKINDEVLIYGICVAVAVIPESLIAVLTVTMAVGTKSMAKGNVIVRKMQALEAVGGVTNICSDKTGTLTQGKMIARKAYIPGLGDLTVHNASSPYDPTNGVVKSGEAVVDAALVDRSKPLEKFLSAIALCNLAVVFCGNDEKRSVPSEKPPVNDSWLANGEPTEISLQVLAMRFGHGKSTLMKTGNWEQLAEHPFDSTVKRMSVVYKNCRLGTVEAFMKGAGEVVIPTLNVSEDRKKELMEKVERLAGEGLRVLCVAYRTLTSNNLDTKNRQAIENGMDFLGLVGLYDPPRLETFDAVRKCQIAGVKVHMLTGDHIRTAAAIAHEVGILAPAIPSALAHTIVMTASHFDSLTEHEIDALEQLPLVIARCSPSTKVRMVEALHRRKAFCVMTGDGVNDSPALKRADVGIAMGLSGSDVAKDASDLVLTDDNFASIVRAVEEGRRLFDNIQKFIMHLLISNISQVILLLIGLAFRDSTGTSVFPLSPLEILWVNMITSSFLALGLGLEEAQPDIMLRPPHDLRQGVFTWEVIIDKTLYGISMGALCLASFAIVIFAGNNGDLGHGCNTSFNDSCSGVFRARATVFAVLSFLLLLTAWEVKHFTRSLFALDPTRHSGPFAVFHALWYNQFLFWAVAAGFFITFPVIYIPVVNTVVFKHTAITWEWGVVVGASVAYLAIIEGWKAVKRYTGYGSSGVITLEDAEARVGLGGLERLTRGSSEEKTGGMVKEVA